MIIILIAFLIILNLILWGLPGLVVRRRKCGCLANGDNLFFKIGSRRIIKILWQFGFLLFFVVYNKSVKKVFKVPLSNCELKMFEVSLSVQISDLQLGHSKVPWAWAQGAANRYNSLIYSLNKLGVPPSNSLITKVRVPRTKKVGKHWFYRKCLKGSYKSPNLMILNIRNI